MQVSFKSYSALDPYVEPHIEKNRHNNISFSLSLSLLAESAGALNTSTASLERGKTPPTIVLDMKQNNLIVELWRMRNTLSLPLLPGPLLLGVRATDKDLSVGQIELFGIETVFRPLN